MRWAAPSAWRRLFVERPTGTFELRRGFRLEPGQKVLLVEDVVTTGLSSREAIAAVEAAGGEVSPQPPWSTARTARPTSVVPFYPLIRLNVPAYAEDKLPPELAALPAEKPGSRKAA